LLDNHRFALQKALSADSVAHSKAYFTTILEEFFDHVLAHLRKDMAALNSDLIFTQVSDRFWIHWSQEPWYNRILGFKEKS
jgi:hypothetical protein